MKITPYVGDSERLYSHDEICPGAPDCVHKDEDKDEEETLVGRPATGQLSMMKDRCQVEYPLPTTLEEFNKFWRLA